MDKAQLFEKKLCWKAVFADIKLRLNLNKDREPTANLYTVAFL